MEFSSSRLEFSIRPANYVGRMMPSFFILASRVVGFNPKISAAPPLPRMRQFVASSTLESVPIQLRLDDASWLQAFRLSSGISALNIGPGVQDEVSLDYIAKLAHVSRPGVLLKSCASCWPALRLRSSEPGSELFQNVPDQLRNILYALPQGRNHDGKNVEPVKQIGTEFTIPYHGCRSRLVAAMTRTLTLIVFELPRRSNSPSCKIRNSLDCTSGREFSDFIQEDRRLVRQLEPSDLPGERSGVGALFHGQKARFRSEWPGVPRSWS